MSGYDGRVGAGSTAVDRSGPVRTVCEDGSGERYIVGQARAGSGLEGVVLDLARDVADLRLVLVDRTGKAVLTLGPFPEEEIIAVWRSLAAASGLTPMMRACTGETEQLALQLGRLRLGPVQDRRRLNVLGRRRPRFLTRRKSSRMPARPVVFREIEIAGGRGR